MNVLVADDSSALRKMLRRILGRTGLPLGEIWEASNGREAWLTLENTAIDLVLSDVNMPQMNGFQLVTAMRGNETLQHIPVILITNEVARLKQQHGFDLGVAGYFGEPFTAQQVQELVTQVLRAKGITCFRRPEHQLLP